MDWDEELARLRSLPSETECVEFKEAKESFDTDEMGCYFSALSNEANLHGLPYAWLVFGIKDKGHSVVGTNYRQSGVKLQETKQHIKQGTNDISFMEIRELSVNAKRVIMFQIPAAPHGIPTSYKKHYYERVHDSLQGLSIEKLERIRAQNRDNDWSAKLTKATVAEVAVEALALAREKYKEKNPRLAEECDKWSDEQFLQKAKISRSGKLTNAGLLLLGKPEAEELLTDGAIAKITWQLKSANGSMLDYEHFGMPVIMAVDGVYARIRNLKYRYISGDTLFPDEVNQYEPYAIREALNNCIAHQDYLKRGQINIVEIENDSLTFSNAGTFLPGSVEEVVTSSVPQEVYRNRRLAESMVGLNMIDTVGSGIRKIFEIQKQKLFPLPDYDLSHSRVVVKITGRVLDMEYARKLARMPNIDLSTMILLDKVNKHKSITKLEAKHLRDYHLIEGRYPNLRVALAVSAKTDTPVEYMRRRAVDDGYCKKMIIDYLKINGVASRREINELLLDKLSPELSTPQRKTKIRNILQALRQGQIIASTSDRKWVLGEVDLDEN